MSAPRQLTMLFGEEFDLPDGGPDVIATGTTDLLPPGPYALGLLYDLEVGKWGPPFRVVGANGMTVAAHIPSLVIAVATRDALNKVYPA
jgi:hypothetical protein